MMQFYLGVHEPAWMERVDVDLFVSRRRLVRRKRLPVAAGRWALDSGGFTEINLFGKWETTPEQYADEAAKYQEIIGGLEWAAIQDWMCEPFALEKTGLSVREHQDRTIESYLRLKSLAPTVPWSPVLQGWKLDDYLRHVDLYQAADVDLTTRPIVGVGSVCRRQGSQEIADLFQTISQLGIRCHGFGVKLAGIARNATSLTSSDSMAWSLRARRSAPLAECHHASCANCLRFALKWRANVMETVHQNQVSRNT